jgi:hypothetical protein
MDDPLGITERPYEYKITADYLDLSGRRFYKTNLYFEDRDSGKGLKPSLSFEVSVSRTFTRPNPELRFFVEPPSRHRPAGAGYKTAELAMRLKIKSDEHEATERLADHEA